MIRLFVSDIDGCLSEPYQPYDLPRFLRLAENALRAEDQGPSGVLPALSICSGRPYAYVEAMTQVLGVRRPVLFESGGGLFDPRAAQVRWHPGFTPEIAAHMEALRHWFLEAILPGTSMMYDYGKRTQVGVIGPDVEEVARYVPVVQAYVERHHPGLCVFHTHVSIDVVAPTITKQQGLQWLAEETGIPLSAMAFIGDTNGDLPALEVVGHPFAPANATEAVRRAARRVTRAAVLEGVLEAYDWCVAYNEARVMEAASG